MCVEIPCKGSAIKGGNQWANDCPMSEDIKVDRGKYQMFIQGSMCVNLSHDLLDIPAAMAWHVGNGVACM